MKKPMPLKDLPAYIDSVRETGQGEIPVVEMGMITNSSPRTGWYRGAAFSAAACLVVGLVGYGVVMTDSMTIVAGDIGPEAVAEIVSGEGGMFVSVKREGEKTYSVRSLNLGNKNHLIQRLRSNKQFDSVDFKD